jgi:hypothetical protein
LFFHDLVFFIGMGLSTSRVSAPGFVVCSEAETREADKPTEIKKNSWIDGWMDGWMVVGTHAWIY